MEDQDHSVNSGTKHSSGVGSESPVALEQGLAPKEYTLRTIKDIFDKVPPDRIDDCMKELTTILTVTSNTVEMIRMIGEDVKELDPELKGFPYPFTFPDEITWKDDGKQELAANFKVGDKPFFRVEVKKKTDDTRNEPARDAETTTVR